VLVVALVAAAGGVAALAALNRGDGSRGPGVAVSTTPAPGATQAPRPALARFYSQRLDWSPCQESFQCATLTVPLDYRHPGGDTLDLALLRVPAGDPEHRIGSLVVNPGGPGVPGTSYAAAADRAFGAPLRERFDIVGPDPRGAGNSDPVDCLSDAELDEYVAGDPDPDTAAEERDYQAWLTAFGEGCIARSGALAAHVSTAEAARDLDVLRAALGESTLSYLGASYGTQLGATYAELFPERVGRFVLDGAMDVSLDNRRLGLEQAEGFETALRAYVQNCVDTTESCFLGDSVDEGLATIDGLLADIEESPLPTSGDRALAIGNAFYGIVAPLYNRDYWFVLSAALGSALDGQGQALMELADLYSSRGQEGYTDNSTEANVAINCLDDPSSVPFGSVREAYPDYEEASPTFGRIFAWSLTTCRGFTLRSSEEPLDIRGEGAAPILVTGTTRDPATPLKWAEALAAQLESGVLLRRDGDGHTAYNAGNECVDDTIEAYLLQGEVPADPTDC
jgi:pimeloyl-ACP methyl ester carboxylesterase